MGSIPGTRGTGVKTVSILASDWAYAADLIDSPQRRWARDPVAWAQEKLGLELWSKQKEILYSIRDHPLTAVHSCHESGKSFVAAVAVAHWLDTHPPGSAFVVTSAPTDKQVKAILWREINKMHDLGNLPGRTNLSEWYIGKELVAFGRKPSDYNPTAFQGLHALYMLLVLDEAAGIVQTMWDAGSTLVANEHGRTLAIGNPDDPLSEFAKKCAPGSPWNTIHIGYEHTPNFTGEDISKDLKSRLIHPKWVKEKSIEWGHESPLFASKCEGKFPTHNADGFIQLQWLLQCRNLELPEGHPVEAGVDVGAGGDRTVIRERRGMRAGRERVFVDADAMRTVGKIVETLNEWNVTRVKVDVIGIGWSIAGRLRELSARHNFQGTTHNAEVVDVNFAAASGDPERFINMRAQTYWMIGREYSRLSKWDLSNVDDATFAELMAPSYHIMDSKGKIKIQAKDEIRSILGRSPDSADALLLAFVGDDWVGEMPMAKHRATSLL